MKSSNTARTRLLPILLLFAGSGCAALIYEIVWFQILQLVIGASAVSLAVLLGAFMGGMCAGALLLPRLIARATHPLRVFAAIEAAIGICGVLLIVVMPLVARLYTAADGGGASSVALRALASLVLLLPPAMLMGATLPAISRYVVATPAGVARLGLLYAGNIFGAVIGCLSAGFYLLPSFDLASASLVAVCINLAVAVAAFILATPGRHSGSPEPGLLREPRPTELLREPRPTELHCEPRPTELRHEPRPTELRHEPRPTELPREPRPTELRREPRPTELPREPRPTELLREPRPTELPREPRPTELPREPRPTELPREPRPTELLREPVPASATPHSLYVAIAISGFTALGAEVVWTRLLSLFGATTYTFSLILAVFLAGLGAGSAIGTVIVRRTASPRVLLGWVQLALCFAIAYGAWMVARTLPYWPIDTSLAPVAALRFRTDLYRAVLAMLPGTVLWGLSFPLAVSAVTSEESDAGAVVGHVYAANTFGAIAGAVLTALVLIPLTGTHGAQRALVATSALSAAVVLLPLVRSSRAGGGRQRALGLRSMSAAVLLTTGVAAAATVTRVPAGLVAWGRLFPWYGDPATLFVGEGINASIAVTEESNGWRNFHVSGKVEASTEPQDMRLQRLLGHITALMHETGPKSALVVGFGAGVTAGAVSIHPSVERLVICELEPLIPKVVSKYFGDVNYDVATDLKLRIVYDDARHYMVTGRETFDVITSDPIHPWVKGAATLYTKEYFEHVRSRLNPGGVATQWVPLYEGTEESVRSVIATFLQVFPHGTVWRNDGAEGGGYDAVLVGRLEEAPIDIDAWQARIDDPGYEKVRRSLAEVGYESAVDLLATYLGRGRDLGPWVAGATINTDRNLRLQYLAGMAVNNNTGTQIRDSMLRYQQFPEDLFTGSPETLSRLKEQIQQPGAP